MTGERTREDAVHEMYGIDDVILHNLMAVIKKNITFDLERYLEPRLHLEVSAAQFLIADEVTKRLKDENDAE
jgi:hypothetical protein